MPKPYLVCREDELKDGDRRVVSCDGTEQPIVRNDLPVKTRAELPSMRRPIKPRCNSAPPA
jgi:hypothetical protein